jgi:hypothetical protein
MNLKDIVIATARGSKKIHAFNLMSDNRRTVCSLELEDVGPFRFDSWSDADTCKTCERQVIRWKDGV